MVVPLVAVTISGDPDRPVLARARRDDRVQDPQVVQAVGEARAAGQLVQPGDLLEEGARLVDEEVALPMADAGEVHRQAAADVRVLGADEHLPVAVDRAGRRRRRS